jgi:nucleoside-diphosphate-sugar epimerase
MVVYGGATGLVDEQSPIAPEGGGYAQAKVAAERLARDYSQRGGNVVVLRPSCIYGPPGSNSTNSRASRPIVATCRDDRAPPRLVPTHWSITTRVGTLNEQYLRYIPTTRAAKISSENSRS